MKKGTKEILVHRGPVSFELIGSLLSDLNLRMDELGMSMSSKKSIYAIVVECLENILKHTGELECKDLSESDSKYCIHFSFEKDGEGTFLVRAGNPLNREQLEVLRDKIDLVNKLSHKEIKELYKNTAREFCIDHKGGAGLGIISIAKLARSKLEYSFEPMDKHMYYFHLLIRIPNVELKTEVYY